MKKIRKRRFALASDGWHKAAISSVEEIDQMPGRFGPKDKLRITFTLDEKDAATGGAITVTSLVTSSLDEKATLHRFIVALTGANPPDTFDPESLVGTSCRVKTAQRANGKGQVFSNVVDLEALRPNERGAATPLKRRGRTAARPVPAEPITNLHGIDIDDHDVEFPGDMMN